MKLTQTIVLVAAIALSSVALASERGYFGLSVSFDSDGFFLNPTLKTVKIDNVAPNSPAAQAGLVRGDLIVEIEGKIVAGTKAKELQQYMQRDVGQSTRMVVKKSSGDFVSMSLVAAQKPVAP